MVAASRTPDMDVHVLLSRRWLAALGIVAVVAVVVGGLFQLPGVFTDEHTVAAAATLGLVVVAVALATVLGQLGGKSTDTPYW